MSGWADEFSTRPVTSNDLLSLHDKIGADVVGPDSKNRVRVLAQALRSRQDRVIGEWRIVRAGDVNSGPSKGAALWALEAPQMCNGLSPFGTARPHSDGEASKGLRGLDDHPTRGEEERSAVCVADVGREASPPSPANESSPLWQAAVVEGLVANVPREGDTDQSDLPKMVEVRL